MYSIEILHIHFKEPCAVPRLIITWFILEVLMMGHLKWKMIFFKCLTPSKCKYPF